MKTLIFSLGLLMSVSVAMAQESTEITWIDASQALEQAPKTGKMVLIDFYTDWCGWCKKMDKSTYADSTVIAYVKEHFLASKVNPEKSGEIKYGGDTYTPRQFASGLHVSAYPTTYIIVPGTDGEKDMAIPISGFRAAEDMLTILRFYGEKAYTTMSYEDFVSSQN